ncbi:hypothetical protein BsWGS_07737 [Bradybaena similaris]
MAIDEVFRFLNNAAGCINFPKDVVIVPMSARLDPFRNSPIRALGHCFAMGEASKFHYTEDVNDILNQVATSYIICHAAYQAFHASGGKASVIALFDSLIFDGIASAIIPSTLTVYIIRMTAVFLREINPMPRLVLRWGPVVSGLAAVVFTYEVIDRCVDQALDETIRSLY